MKNQIIKNLSGAAYPSCTGRRKEWRARFYGKQKRILQADAYSIQKKFIFTFAKMAAYGIPLNNCAMLPKAPKTLRRYYEDIISGG